MRLRFFSARVPFCHSGQEHRWIYSDAGEFAYVGMLTESLAKQGHAAVHLRLADSECLLGAFEASADLPHEPEPEQVEDASTDLPLERLSQLWKGTEESLIERRIRLVVSLIG